IFDPPGRGARVDQQGEILGSSAVIVSPEASEPVSGAGKPPSAGSSTLNVPRPVRWVGLGALVLVALILLLVGLRRKPEPGDRAYHAATRAGTVVPGASPGTRAVDEAAPRGLPAAPAPGIAAPGVAAAPAAADP